MCKTSTEPQTDLSTPPQEPEAPASSILGKLDRACQEAERQAPQDSQETPQDKERLANGPDNDQPNAPGERVVIGKTWKF